MTDVKMRRKILTDAVLAHSGKALTMNSPSRVQLRGVLLEGLNFAGKTTTSARLHELFEARGDRADNRHCHVTDGEITTTLQTMAKQSVRDTAGRMFPDPDLLRRFNVLKSSQMIVDSALAVTSPYAVDDGPILVQDRHWFTQFCSNEFFNPGEGYLSEQWRRRCSPQFTVQIYLVCSGDERRRRGSTRDGDAHGLNAYLRANLDKLEEYDAFCCEKIADDPTWSIISTDDLSPDEIAVAAITQFDRIARSSHLSGVASG